MAPWSSKLSKGKPLTIDMHSMTRRLTSLSPRWASQEALEQHQQRAWLRSMYAIFDEKSLLESPEEIETLMFLSGFATR